MKLTSSFRERLLFSARTSNASARKFISSFCIAVTFLVLILSASFAARNSDFFSVAGGRLLGQFLGFIAAIDMLLIAGLAKKFWKVKKDE